MSTVNVHAQLDFWEVGRLKYVVLPAAPALMPLVNVRARVHFLEVGPIGYVVQPTAYLLTLLPAPSRVVKAKF